MYNENEEVLSVDQVDQMITDTKRAILLETLKLEKHMKANKIQYFVPSPKQHLFFSAADKKRRAVFAGNRFGKSTAGVIEDICFAFGYRPFYPEGDENRYKGIPDRGVKILIIAEDWDKVKEIFTNNEPGADRPGKFFEWLPPEAISKVEKNSLGVIYVIHVETLVHGRKRKSSIYFDTVRSFKSNGAAHESSDWDVVHCDEPIPNDMWVAVSRGLIDRSGHAWMLLTPLREAWLHDYMTENAAARPDIFHVINADMSENPSLDPAEIELYLSQLSPEERDCRQKGIPLQSGRLVYHHFNDKVHLIDCPAGWENASTPPSEGWDVSYAIDPHPQTPHAVLFVAVSPSSVVFFADLFVKMPFTNITNSNGQVTTFGLAHHIRRYVSGQNLVHEICDPTAWIQDPQTGRCWADSLHEAGLKVTKASKAKTQGILEMNEWFAGARSKRIFVTSACTNLLREIRKYHYDKENKPVDANDHIMECMYRLCAKDGFQYYGQDSSVSAGHPIDDENADLTEFNNSRYTK